MGAEIDFGLHLNFQVHTNQDYYFNLHQRSTGRFLKIVATAKKEKSTFLTEHITGSDKSLDP